VLIVVVSSVIKRIVKVCVCNVPVTHRARFALKDYFDMMMIWSTFAE